MPKPLIEIIACSAGDCARAKEGGADRIELCAAIEMGGLTPSIGLVEQSISATDLPIMAMVRPRSGGFNYAEDEFSAMIADVLASKKAGAKGVVFGVLTDGRRFDIPRMRALVEVAEGMETVCHRAFDATPDAEEALEELVGLKITRLLTSGHRPTALEGKELIKSLRLRAAGRIQILPASGLTAQNVGLFVRETGVDQVHLTAFEETRDESMDGVQLTFNGRDAWEAAYRTVSGEAVAEIARATSSPS